MSVESSLHAAQLQFAEQAVTILREHGVDDIDVSISRDAFDDCLRVIGRMGPNGDYELFVSISIPDPWNEEVRQSLEAEFELIALGFIEVAK